MIDLNEINRDPWPTFPVNKDDLRELINSLARTDRLLHELIDDLARTHKLLNAYRDAVVIAVDMSGPKFVGVNNSALKRAWNMDS